MKIGVVIVTTSNLDRVKDCISAAQRIGDVLIGVFPNGNHGSFQGLDHKIFLKELPNAKGSAEARNIGAKYLMDQGCDWLIFPNDSTLVSQTFFNCLEILNSNLTAEMYLGHYLYGDNRIVYSPIGFARREQLLAIMEAAIVIKSDVFKELNGFDKDIGTGSYGMLWSGEAADLSIRAFDNGITIYGIDMVLGHDHRLYEPKTLLVEIKYALGHAVVRKRHFSMLSNALMIFAPVISVFNGGVNNSAFRLNIKSSGSKMAMRLIVIILGHRFIYWINGFLANRRNVHKT